MNIEENNFYNPIILAGKKLKHVHITESHRGMLGEGTVNWDELFKALKEINFEGNLVLENFSSSIPECSRWFLFGKNRLMMQKNWLSEV